MFSSALCFVILRLGASHANVLPFLIRSFGFLLEGSVPKWSVQRLVAVPWIEPSSVYSHIAVQFPADSDVYFSAAVDMCGWLQFLFPTLLFTGFPGLLLLRLLAGVVVALHPVSGCSSCGVVCLVCRWGSPAAFFLTLGGCTSGYGVSRVCGL